MSDESAAPATVETIVNGQAFGSLASILLNNDGDTRYMRPAAPMVANATLQHEEWLAIDAKVREIATQRMRGVADLVNRGLVYRTNGLGDVVLAGEKSSDMTDADVNMDAATPPTEDRIDFDIEYLPLPVISKGFRINARVLAASRRRGSPLDTRSVGTATRKVIEQAENILFTGGTNVQYGGGTVYGYLDHPSKNDYTLSAHWNDSAATGSTILADVLGMKQASITDRHYGPWALYVPTNFETALDEDFKANSDLSVRERLMEVDGIESIVVADKLTSDYVVLVQLTEDTVQMVIGMDPTTIQWQSGDGFVDYFKVVSIMVPRLRADKDGRMGLVVGTK